MSETGKEKGLHIQAEGSEAGRAAESELLPNAQVERPRRGLAARLTWAFVAVAGVVLLVVGLVLTYISYSAQVEQIIIRQQKTADGAAVLTSEYLTRARDTLSILGNTASGSGLLLRSFENQQAELLEILFGYEGMFQGVSLVDGDGDELAKVSRFETYSLEDFTSLQEVAPFRRALEGQVYVDAEARLMPYATFPAVLVAVPIKPRAGTERRGVLMADVSLEGMWDAVAQVEVGETGYAYIVDRDTGVLVAHSNPDRYLELRGLSLDEVPIVRQVMEGEADFQHQYRGLEGTRVVGAASGLPGTNWTLIVELPTGEALADVRQMLYLLGILIVLGAVAAGSLGLVVPRLVVQPLMTLREGVQEIGEGHLDRIIRVETGDEIQELAEAFNQMAANLQLSQAELERWGHELETMVDERTQELTEVSQQMQRRAVQLEASAEVARAISSVRDLDVLLPQVARFISERFGWYHVGIFLLDEAGKYAVLRAANSEGGQRMLARDHRLRVGEMGIVGYVTHTGSPRVALDVGRDAVYFDNPDMPDTHSEMALPLVVGDRIIGALDVQSTETEAYDDEDVALLRILADQVAIAIENALLFEETQQALADVQALHRRYIEREWTKVTGERRELSYEYRRSGVPPLGAWPPELARALSDGEVVASTQGSGSPEGRSGDDGGNGPAEAALAAPIKFRDQIIGALDLQEIDEPRQWTEDEIALVQAISDQVGLALENARLFADAQRRAEQMATINRIGLSINSDLDLTGVLNALHTDIQRMLDADSFYVALYEASTGLIEFPLIVGADGVIELQPRHINQVPGVTGYVIHSRRSLHLPDLQSLPQDAPFDYVAVDEDPTRSYIGVPLLFRDRVIGVLSVQSNRPSAYSQEDVELLETVATQASIAIENARAYERLAETAEELREIDRF
jgi:GAF domain-containing protein/HAMP domain-containing protein